MKGEFEREYLETIENCHLFPVPHSGKGRNWAGLPVTCSPKWLKSRGAIPIGAFAWNRVSFWSLFDYLVTQR